MLLLFIFALCAMRFAPFTFVSFRGFRDSHLPPKRPAQQRLEQMFRLALGLALLGAQPLEFLNDVGELLLEREGRDNCGQVSKNLQRYELLHSAC